MSGGDAVVAMETEATAPAFTHQHGIECMHYWVILQISGDSQKQRAERSLFTTGFDKLKKRHLDLQQILFFFAWPSAEF